MHSLLFLPREKNTRYYERIIPNEIGTVDIQV